jgi:cytochrome P450
VAAWISLPARPGCILRQDGAAHAERRRLLSPAFHGGTLTYHRPVIAGIAERELARWPVGRPVAVLPRMQDITFAVIAHLVLGITAPGCAGRLHRFVRRSTGPSALAGTWLWPLGAGRARDRAWRRLRRHQGAVNDVLTEFIESYRENGAGHHHALGLLLNADHEGAPGGGTELREELQALLVVGHETTAAALAWAVERLVREQAVLARLEDSVRAGDTGYLKSFIHEVLRWRPPVVDSVRVLTEPMEFAGHALGAGTLVMVSPLLLHQHAGLYPSPEAFQPGRFAGQEVPGPERWIPFGGGTRRCLGAELAVTEMEIIISEMLAAFVLAPAGSRPERAVLAGTVLVPARGARAVVSRRQRK